jgi:hypothetical protein
MFLSLDLRGDVQRRYCELNGASELVKLAVSGVISPEEFERELWGLSKGHTRRARSYKAGDIRIYRTRIWDDSERPRTAIDLSYPPKTLAPLGRANLEGESVFYASAGLPTTFVECGLEKGQHVVCSEWRNTIDLILQEVGLSTDSGASELERIYHEIFTSLDPAMYRFSARVARHLLGGGAISGLVYPSIASQNASTNVALKTEFVDSGLRLVNASLYFVKDASRLFKYEIEEIDFGVPDHEGSLNWKGRKRTWVLRKQGDTVRMVSNGWGWDGYDPAGVLVSPE